MDEEFIKPVKTMEQLAEEAAVAAKGFPVRPKEEAPLEIVAAPQKLSETPRKPDFHTVPTGEDNTNKNFKGQQKNEIVLAFSRKHWIVLFPKLIMLIFILVLPVALMMIYFRSDPGRFMNPYAYKIIVLLGMLGFTYYLHRIFISAFNFYLQTFIITNLRVIHLDQTLFFSRNRESMDLHEIQDVEITQNGLIKTLLNYGEVTITLSNAYASKTLSCLPNPEYFFRKINKTKRQYIIMRTAEKTGGKTGEDRGG